jgi:hypothetical protein
MSNLFFKDENFWKPVYLVMIKGIVTRKFEYKLIFKTEFIDYLRNGSICSLYCGFVDRTGMNL